MTFPAAPQVDREYEEWIASKHPSFKLAGREAFHAGRAAAAAELAALREQLEALKRDGEQPPDIEDALRLAEEFCADPDKRAQVRVQLAMNGWGKLADMIDEAVKVSRAFKKVCGRE